MRITTIASRSALVAALLAAAAASTADAKPRRVVILDFDGPRNLADVGRNEVVSLLGEQYDVIAKKRWEDARARAQQKSAGPTTWQKASRSSGVDAVIEGWVQDEGRHKLLTVAVREAATGQELDTVSVRLNASGLSDVNRGKLQTELDGVLAYIEGSPDPVGTALKVIDTRKMIGAKAPRVEVPARTDDDELAADEEGEDDRPRTKRKPKRARVADAGDELEITARENATPEDPADTDLDADTDAPKPRKRSRRAADAEVAVKEDEITAKESSDLVTLFGATSDEGKIVDPKASHTPVPTPRFQIGGGLYYGSRSLNIAAENQTGVTPYAGVPSKGLEISAAVYPLPLKKLDGHLSGIGFSFAVSKSAGSEVSFDDGETVTEYVINQSSFQAGVHWRQPLAELVSLDGEVSYGKSSYLIPDAPETFEVPDVEYSYLGAGARLDLHITDKAQVGFGGRYYYLLDVGDISSVDWYGPGRASGFGLNARFEVPLPKSLYVAGAIAYDRFKIVYDGVGAITDEEGVSESSDATVNASLNVGVQF